MTSTEKTALRNSVARLWPEVVCTHSHYTELWQWKCENVWVECLNNDPLEDLNCAAAICSTLNEISLLKYLDKLQTICGIEVPDYWSAKAMMAVERATALQQFDALVKILS